MSKKPASAVKKTADPKEPAPKKAVKKAPTVDAALKKASDKISAALSKLGIARYDGRVPGWISTGDWVTDLMLSLGKGIPQGRMVHIYGRKHSGKTVRALAIAAQVLANGGIVHWFNQESGWDGGLALTMGVDPDHSNFHLYPPQHLEKAADAIVEIVKALKGVNIAGLIVLDSLGGSCTEGRDDKSVEDGRTVSEIARTARDFCNKLVPHMELTRVTVLITNHTWLDFSQYTPPGMPKPEKPSGGEAVPFYSALELKISRGQAEKTKEGKVRYRRLTTEVVKNKVAPTSEYKWTSPFYLRSPANRVSGFDEGMCCLDFMVHIKAWTKLREGYQVYLTDGEVFKISRKDFRNRYLDDDEFSAEVRNVVEAAFKKYYGL